MIHKNKILLCLATTVLLFSCNNNGKKDDETTKTYNVTLNANGGSFESSSSETKIITNCTTLAKADLEEPIKNNSGFKGWYLDTSSTNQVTFPYTLDKDTTLYAGWSNMPTGDFEYQKDDCITVSDPVNNVYTITVDTPKTNSTPTITLSGSLNDAQLLITPSKAYKSTGGEINVVLNNFKIVSTDSLPPINISKCDNVVNITCKDGTSNFIFDKRSSSGTFDDDGAINAKSNLNINGNGYLYVNDKTSYQGFSDGIYCSKNITINNVNLNAYATKNSIRGKRSITINDANIVAYSKTGNGLKTSDEDIQDNKRCGDININGKTSLTVATAKHGISASHDLNINSNESGSPKINVYTSTYASSYVTIETPTITEKDMYIYMPNSSSFTSYADQNNYRFAVLFSDGNWDNATLKKFHSAGMREGPQLEKGSEGYYFGLDRPIGATTYQIYLFDKNHDANSTTEGEYVAKMENPSSFPPSGDTAKISTLSGNAITTQSSFGTYDSMIDKSGNSEKSTYGCKGMAAGNTININDGIINIRSKDDSLQGKYGKLFPADSDTSSPREIGTGDVNINGDNTKIYILSADDAIHGTNLNIGNSGCPTIQITNSYEGLEAAVINYKNGNASIYARDDGVNGANIGNISGSNVSINVSGGYLDVQVGSGDTDGIDSNNTYTQTGGIVVSRASSNNIMSTPLDTDGSASVSNNGIFIGIGIKPEANISCSKSNGPISKTFDKNSEHTINNTYKFTVTSSYSQYYCYLGNSASNPTIN